MKNYKNKYKELRKLPENIKEIYIIPSKPYDGFWGQNGYRSFDFIFGNNKEIYGWCHWEGDIISLYNSNPFEMRIDSPINSNSIRLFTDYEFQLDGFITSSLDISVVK